MSRKQNDRIEMRKIQYSYLTFLNKRVMMYAEQEKDPQNQLPLIMRVPSVELKCFKYYTAQYVDCQRSLVTFKERRTLR